MFFKVQLMLNCDRSWKALYREINNGTILGTQLNNGAIPTDPIEMYKKFNIYWIDEDHHKVMIICPMDTTSMIAYFQQNPKQRPIFYLEEIIVPGAAPVEPITNWSLFCSKCNIQIVGFCYKCTECENFNLCSHCESRRMHEEHVMLRFNSPDEENSFNEKFLIEKKTPNCMGTIWREIQQGKECSNCEGSNVQAIPIIDKNFLKTGLEILGNFSEMLLKMARYSGFLNRSGNQPEDTDPALSTLYDRFRKTIIEVEENISRSDCDTTIAECGKIEDIIKEIIERGYRNKDNWLADLLVTCNGDIHKAKDLVNNAF